MKRMLKAALLALAALPVAAGAQRVVDRNKYPDFSSTLNPDPALMVYGSALSVRGLAAEPVSERPDHVNNAASKYFPPIFNQDGGSCGSASRICYMFTHELNAYRDADGSLLQNNYPSHFVWLLTNGNSGKDEFVQFVGVPSAEAYGGRTYSGLFGYQEETNNDFGWMTGYDKWFAAMHNRMLRPANMAQSLGTKAGREALKNWLWNHNGDADFKCGGVVGIGVASGGDWQPIGKTAANDEAGVTGLYYVNHWGASVDHALTIVGYDDRVEFDLNGNGIYGETSADEKGAWIIANSWGAGWCNAGLIYCPYAYAGSYSRQNTSTGKWTFSGDWWYPEVYYVRKDYRPLRTIKLLMDYSRRSEIYLSAGISADLNADAPEKTLAFDHFKYAGDGANGNTNPAPEIPMLGRWADGKLHEEPMEFGYDLTDLSNGFDKSQPLKYFFIVETRSWGLGTGHIRQASIIDYEDDPEGVETPFDLGTDGIVEVKSAGEKTIISVVVYGQQFYAPQNAAVEGTRLTWQAPTSSRHAIDHYRICKDGTEVGTTAPTSLSFDLSETGEGFYAVSAVYEGGHESAAATTATPVSLPERNEVVNFKKSGFSIPDVFSTKYDEATLEFWIKPNALSDWNQSAGPGWGTFMIHANADGSFTAGWNTTTNNRCSTPAGMLSTSKWAHVAVVVDKNTVRTYINGKQAATCTSASYSGIGGFGDFTFTASSSNNSNLNAYMDEIRVWDHARTAEQLMAGKDVEYDGALMPDGLLAYYKGNVLTQDGSTYLRDCIGGHHARILNTLFTATNSPTHTYGSPAGEAEATICVPEGGIYAGVPTTLTATRSESVNALSWTAKGAGINGLLAATATLTFAEAGEQPVTLTAYSATQPEGVEVTSILNVLPTPKPDAAFTPTATQVSAGQRVSFIVDNPQRVFSYDWQMPGADKESSSTVNAAATYSDFGNHTVTLTVTTPDGQKATVSRQINVVEVVPEPDFTIAPAVVLKGNTTFLQDASKYGPTAWKWHLQSAKKDILINGRNTSLVAETPGVYDVTLYATNGEGTAKKTAERGLIVVNADSRNGLNFSQSGARVTASAVPFTAGQRTFTIDWWMRPAKLSDYCLGIGESESTFLLKTSAAGAMIACINGKQAASADKFVIAGQWHHYAVTFASGTVKFFRDGVLVSTKAVSGASSLPQMNSFAIGNGAAEMSGSIDEFRVWGTNLSRSATVIANKLQTYANQPIDDVAAEQEAEDLRLYYSFNQNGGNVTDATSNANTGIRSGFGPDGDAWGLSKGVFCLDFESTDSQTDVTANYLKNYKKAFKYDSNKQVNTSQSRRWYAITDWTLENTVTEGTITSGVHVDLNKNTCFTATSGWDGFGTLADHKAYQTVTLPAGAYTFSATYDTSFEGQCGSSYLAVAEGTGLPNTSDLSSQALGFTAMVEKSQLSDRTNSVTFILTEETTVSIGLVINMTGSILMAIEKFALTRTDVTELDADNVTGYDLDVSSQCLSSLYLPYSVVLPDGVTAYVATGIDESRKQVSLAAITDRVIPARTAAIIQTDGAGTFHFTPTENEGTATSLLSGVLEDTTPADGTHYMVPAGSGSDISFVNLAKTDDGLLRANRAFFTTSEAADAYTCRFTEVGVDGITLGADGRPAAIYDLSGRRIRKPAGPGIYIVGGKKIIVK